MDRSEFFSILIDQLVQIELSFLSDSAEQIAREEVRTGYEKLLAQLTWFEQLSSVIFLYSLALAKILAAELTHSYRFNRGEFLFVYTGALLLSLKLLDDSGVWYAEDFAKATDISVDLVSEMETFVFIDVLQFNLRVTEQLLEQEWLAFQLSKTSAADLC